VIAPFLHPLATTAFATGNKRMPPGEGVQKEAGKAVQVTITTDNNEHESVCDNIMITDAVTIKVSTKDSILIDRFVELGKFESRGEFVIFSIKKTINELLLKEFGEKAYSMAQLSDKDVDNLLTEIKNIRKRLWSEYAKHLS